jgi:hypothetical protein
MYIGMAASVVEQKQLTAPNTAELPFRKIQLAAKRPKVCSSSNESSSYTFPQFALSCAPF